MVRIRFPPRESPQTIGSADDFTRLIPIIQNHPGSIVKFLGDGVIATFGVARPSPTYAADATVALDEALGEIDRWNAHRHAAGLDPVAVNAALTIGQAMRLDALARFEDADFPQMRVLGRDAAEIVPHCWR